MDSGLVINRGHIMYSYGRFEDYHFSMTFISRIYTEHIFGTYTECNVIKCLHFDNCTVYSVQSTPFICILCMSFWVLHEILLQHWIATNNQGKWKLFFPVQKNPKNSNILDIKMGTNLSFHIFSVSLWKMFLLETIP